MNNVKIVKPKAELYGLIRDKNGKPKIDDINTCHPKILAMLTTEELEELKNGTNIRNSRS